MTAADWYHCRVGTMSRSAGRSAVAAAAYRMGISLRDRGADVTHDYSRRSGVLRSYLLAPEGAPAWAYQPEAVWNAVEFAEKRSNSTVAREVELALPASVSAQERNAIARAFAEELVERYGVAVTVALHEPSRFGDDRNYHAHILFTTRVMGPRGLGEKTRILDDIRKTGPEEVRYLREFAADLINDALERAGLDERVDHRSFKDRGIDQEPTEHLGPTASQMEREGKSSERGDRNREITDRNEELDRLVDELAEVEAELLGEQERLLDERYGVPPDEVAEQPDQPKRELSDNEKRRARDSIRDAEAASPQPSPGGIRHHGLGMPWWQHATVWIEHLAEQAFDWIRDTWQRFVEWQRGPGDDGPGLSR